MAYTSKKPSPTFNDPDFFHKSELSLGSVLQNVGRRNPGSFWEVTRIITKVLLPSGGIRRKSIAWVEKTQDEVTLRQLSNQPSPTIIRPFAALSYSSIWRLTRKR